MTRLVASINKSALSHNLNRVRLMAPGAKVLAMVKANAYGHGLIGTALTLEKADAFGVAAIDEGAALRGAGVKSPIVLMQGVFTSEELKLARDNNLSIVLHHKSQFDLIKKEKLSIDVWVKVNTGFNRLGFKPNEVNEVIGYLESNSFNIACIMTHFARANEQDDDSVIAQMQSFNNIHHPNTYPISMANSAGILGWPESHCDWVRPGLMLYGVSPFPNILGADLGLVPAMTLKSKLISTYDILKGEKVGYGWHYTAPKDMKVGVISVGYGDGYPWMQNKMPPVLINGEKTQIIGQVAMDMMAISLDGIEGAEVGDYVTLWGDGLAVEDVALALDISPYALLTSVTSQRERLLRELKVGSLQSEKIT